MNQIPGFSGEPGASPQGPAMKPSSLLGAVLSGSASVTSGLFTTLLILFYLLASGDTFLRRMVEILPRFKDKRQAVELSQHIERDVSAYLLTVACINALVGVATGCVMWGCGVANPVLWGALAFVLNFVPILGAMVGMAVFLMASVVSLGVFLVGTAASRAVPRYPHHRGRVRHADAARAPLHHQSGRGDPWR